jgi:conjugal transfer pilus assembly protein TraW
MIQSLQLYNKYNIFNKLSTSILLILLACHLRVSAKDLGTYGTTFAIEERSMLIMLEERLRQAEANGKLASLQQQMQDRVQQKVLHSTPVPGLQPTQTPRSYFYDPTITVQEDLKDHQGRVFHKAGTRLNPLKYVSWSNPLLLINGDDAEQMQWALAQNDNPKIVLTAGSPIELMRQTGARLYFDQGGLIVKKFEITQVPCRISQQGDKLLIEKLTMKGN